MLRYITITGFALSLCLVVPWSTVFAEDEVASAEVGGSPSHVSHEGHAAEGGDHGSEGAGGHGDKATPPLHFSRDLALWSMIVFVLLLVVLKKTAWGPMIEGLDRRESGIRSAIAEAEDNHRKSQALLADYEGKLRDADQAVAEMIAEAKRDAERTSQDVVAKTQSEVEAMRQRATDEIGRARDAALADVFESVNSRIALATEHVLGRAMTSDDQERLVEEALREIGA
jgi:F-type H+-transporting ATPase subunit b